MSGTAVYRCLGPVELEEFLERRRASLAVDLDLSLADNLSAILRKANEFVPSEAGSILLDDPKSKRDSESDSSLTFIAAFGSSSDKLLGRRIPIREGIAGHVYRSGDSYRTGDASQDDHFYAEFDQLDDYRTESLVAIPIRIEKEVCGVLELVNRKGVEGYSGSDLKLLEIFAGYISISIQNVLDGRQAQEIAKRDNLTGLYNDRYLHITLSRTLADCRENGRDLALLFLDLDFFKHVNDSHGHLAGSQVLQEVGALLRSVCSPDEAILARYGGDEFVIALPGASLDQGVDVAEQLREAMVSHHFCTAPGEIQPDPLDLTGITCSIGVATLRRHLVEELDIERCKSTLLRLSDAAMYVAKETGRNRTAVAGEPVKRRIGLEHPAPN